MLRGSPAPMPGALFALRVLVITPKLVELDTTAPGFAQLIVLKRLKTSSRSCSDVPPLNLVVLNTDTSTLLNPGPYSAFRSRLPKVPGAGVANAAGLNHCSDNGTAVGCTTAAYGSPTRFGRSERTPVPLASVPVVMLNGRPLWKVAIVFSCQPSPMRPPPKVGRL